MLNKLLTLIVAAYAKKLKHLIQFQLNKYAKVGVKIIWPEH